MEISATSMDNLNLTFFDKAKQPLPLKFEDVVYKVKERSKSSSKEKIILNKISGTANPGEILAMLGPSGSGKTTLLTALAGRIDRKNVDGSITYNGKPYSNSLKRKIGFVTQDDILYQHLTVTEMLVFTALLRLPNNLTKQLKIEHAHAVISQLGLTRCKDSCIGGPFMRGISGGERRRVSIGQEVLTNPSLLFLDEPTSGLDSTTAEMIVTTVTDLARGGMSIVMTIHQPSSKLFYMFNKVLLLSEGNCLYFGNGGQHVVNYFSTLGFSPPFAMNPSDFLLDLANGISYNNDEQDRDKVKQTLAMAYKCTLVENLKGETLKEDDTITHEVLEIKNQFTTTWWQQFSILFQRGIKERRHETFSMLKVAQILILAVIAGLLWWQTNPNHLQDQMGLIWLLTAFCGIYPLQQAVFLFPKERNMLAKERSSGMYRLSSYFLAKTCTDLPMELILPLTFMSITYWMAGLKCEAKAFIYAFLVISLDVLVGQGLGLAVGALILDQQVATTTATIFMFTFQLIGGFFVQQVPSFIAWIKNLSFIHFAYKLLLSTQYKKGQTYYCGTHEYCLVRDFPLIRSVGLGEETIPLIMLGVMLVVYRLIAYVALLRVGLATN